MPLVVLILLCLLAWPSAAQARPDQLVTFEAPELRDPAQRPAALADLDALGVRALRVVLYWRDVAPAQEGGAYDFGRYDPIVQAAEARGWQVLLTVSGPVPAWATRSGRSTVTNPIPAKFQAFAELVARRYGTAVETFSIWNEPNHPDFLRPQYRRGRPVSGPLYRRLADAGLRGLAAGGVPGERVLLGETAPIGTRKVVAPLTFLRQVLSRGRLDVAGWAHHPYTRAEGPFYRPPSRNAVTIGTLSRLTRALDVAARQGRIRRSLPVWLTEFGVQSFPDELAGVSLLRQAEYRSIAERIASENRRVAAFSQYLLRDDRPAEGASRAARHPGFESGLRTFDGKQKPAFEGFQLPVAALRRGSNVSLWGLVRPAKGAVDLTLTANDGAGYRPLATIRTDDAGRWRFVSPFERGRRYRVEWTAPDGTVRRGAPTRAYRRPS